MASFTACNGSVNQQRLVGLTNRPSLTFVFSPVCAARPASPFANVSYSLEEDGALISWKNWGPEKNVYVEYMIDNSKQSIPLSFMHRWEETPTSLLAPAGNKKDMIHIICESCQLRYGCDELTLL